MISDRGCGQATPSPLRLERKGVQIRADRGLIGESTNYRGLAGCPDVKGGQGSSVRGVGGRGQIGGRGGGLAG